MVGIFFIFYFYFFIFSLTKRKKLPGHEHPLFTDRYIRREKRCSECHDDIYKDSYNYSCKICKMWWHRECMPTSSKAVNHQFHPKHALKLLVGGAPDYTDGKCDSCDKKIRNCVYHCSICNFSLDVRCRYSSRPIKIKESKSHNHPLTLMVRKVSYVCNACGIDGDRNPYMCIECSFMVHRICVDMPHVININRHNHRIYHTYSLRPGKRLCKVCRLDIDWMYGAYSCPRCPDFVVHSLCATDRFVWDGKELDGVSEEKEDTPMFKMIGENVINHVKHSSHNLRLTDDGVLRDELVRCQLCHGLIYSDKFYNCMECDYVLHETCAYLPKTKRNVFSPSPLVLKEFVPEANGGEFYKCFACKQPSSGHMYSSQSGRITIDLRCAGVDWSCDHECHPHTLFFTTVDRDKCRACKFEGFVLRCIDCKFNLCYQCANYPKKIMHRCDDHPLVLSFGDKEQHGTNWCIVCEARVDLKKWFYECEECGIVCHIQCVLGDFTNFNPRLRTTKNGITKGVVRNNGSTRPHCSLEYCATSGRCLAPFIYSSSGEYYCSYDCAGWTTEKERVARYVEKAAIQFCQD